MGVELMTPAAAKAQETRKRHRELWRQKEAALEAERAATIAALTAIRDDENASPETRLEAIKMIQEMRKNRYI